MKAHQIAALCRQCESVKLHAARHLHSQQELLKAIERLRLTLNQPSLPLADFAGLWNKKRFELGTLKKMLDDRKA